MFNARVRNAYITAAGVFLPGAPVGNDEMEAKLGLIGGIPSRYRATVLRANRIKSRHYAIDEFNKQTHLNEELAANAVVAALANRGFTVQDVDLLATGTTLADSIMPGFGSMVHGRLGGRTMDVLSAAGICSASMTALKSAVNAIKVGEHNVAVSVGSELVSPFLKSSRFTRESSLDDEMDKANSYQFFNADFLRWMLSDGAGAVVLEAKPHPNKLSLRVDWIEYRSYANEWPTCMYLGMSKTQNLKVGDTYGSYNTMTEADQAGMFVIRQDTDILLPGLTASVVTEAERLTAAGKIVPDQIDYFLPHISSYFFYEKLKNAYEKVNINIPQEKWFTNLATKGNTGAASIYIMLEECLNTNKFKPGERILCMVPESGRFSVSYAHFTCVDAGGA